MSRVLTVSLSEEVDEKLRRLAREKYGGRKGSISRVISELVIEEEEDREQQEIARRAIARLRKGYPLGFGDRRISREEMHARGP